MVSLPQTVSTQRMGTRWSWASLRSALDMPLLTLSMAGSQVVWSLELGYGTPYLLSIGLSKEATGLVWLAGPLSGLIVQPIIGSLSDSSVSCFRRRKYMVGSAIILALSTLLIAFSEPISEAVLNVLDSDLGTWDPVHKVNVRHMVQALSIIGFWLLDFALNALQVVSRALILDHADTSEQNRANAWHGRMQHVGKIMGYWSGWVDLSHSSLLSWAGGDQFRKFAIISIACMFAGVGITCYTTPEPAAERTHGRTVAHDSVWMRMSQSVSHVWQISWSLPPSIRSVCCVQLFNSMGWFPFLFYSTTYVINASHAHSKRLDDMEQLGSFALLLFALFALGSGILLPFLSLAGTLQDTFESDSLSPTRHDLHFGRVTLRSIWTCGTVVHFLLLFMGTWFVTDVKGTIVLVMLMGIPWSISCWVPFALIGEFVREAERQGHNATECWAYQPQAERVPQHTMSFNGAADDIQWKQRSAAKKTRISSISSLQYMAGSCSSVVSRGTEVSRTPSDIAVDDSARGGTILGIHNLAIVLPQFLMSLLVALIFRIVAVQEKGRSIIAGDGGIAWVIRFGGFMALCAAFVTRTVPLTLTEKHALNMYEYRSLPPTSDVYDDDISDAASIGEQRALE